MRNKRMWIASLVGPNGATLVFMSDIGGAGSASVFDITFDDAAAALAPGTTITGAGPFSFKPTNNNIGVATDTFVAPAPAGPYNDAAPTGASTFASVFGGLTGASVNGDWKLYVMDDIGGDNGSCAGGWQITIDTVVSGSPTNTTLTSSVNPSLTTQAVTFTATVLKTSDSTPASGTVTFTDSTTGATLASNVALNGSGQAQTTANANTLTERRHLMVATFTPAAGFLGSTGQLTQTVDFPTSNPSTGVYANTNGISVPDPALGTSRNRSSLSITYHGHRRFQRYRALNRHAGQRHPSGKPGHGHSSGGTGRAITDNRFGHRPGGEQRYS